MSETDKIWARIDAVEEKIAEERRAVNELQKEYNAVRLGLLGLKGEHKEKQELIMVMAKEQLEKAETALEKEEAKEKELRDMLREVSVALVTAQGMTKRQSSPSGHTPYSDAARPKKDTLQVPAPQMPAKQDEQQSPPKPESVAVPLLTAEPCWKLCSTVVNGIQSKGLRKKILTEAEGHVAYDGTIEYTKEGGSLTGKSDLEITLYFKCEKDAQLMDTCIKTCAKKWGAEAKDRSVSQVKHVCEVRVEDNSYRTPVDDIEWGDRERFEPQTSHSEPSTMVEESVYLERGFTRGGAQPQRCHIIPKSLLKELPDLNKHNSNFIYLEPTFHSFYDGTSDNRPPHLSFYCDSILGNTLTIRTTFYTDAPLEYLNILRTPHSQVDKRDFTFKVDHPDPEVFQVLLNLRHDFNELAQTTNRNIQVYPLSVIIATLAGVLEVGTYDSKFKASIFLLFGVDSIHVCKKCGRSFATALGLGTHDRSCKEENPFCR
eukprot:TRINITY_DN37410_c0_g1_i1.p1 TRINITY_DN37410_c0_g1~~TRINITY_DN37410_c0_g1_i1.p1  ORF type:complete len:488 (+),score=53.67 TRINITY_DN37410_c0_g1_i1:64-1527(+)